MNTAGCNQHVSGLANALHCSSGCYKKEARALPLRMLLWKAIMSIYFHSPQSSQMGPFQVMPPYNQPQALEEKCHLPSWWPWRLSSPSSIGALSIMFWHLNKMDSTTAEPQKLQKPKKRALASNLYIAKYLRALKERLNIMPKVRLNYHFRYQN